MSRSVRLGSLYRRRDETGQPELPLLSVYRDWGVVLREGRDDNYNKPGNDLAAYRVVRPGDLVLNKMKTWQGSLGVSDYEGIVSPAYFIAESRRAAHPRFMHHLLRSQPLIAEYGARSKGIRPSQWDLPWDEFRAIRVELPSEDEQRRIADFLDRETARIDALIDLRQKQIELSGERLRSALAFELFTWPTDTWGPISRVIDLLPGYAFPSDDFSSQAAGRVPLLRGINVAPGRLRWDECVYLSHEAPAPLSRRYGLQEGDLVLGMDRPFVGSGTRLARISKSDLPCLLVQRVARIRPRAAITPEYLRLLLQSEAFEAHCAPAVTGVSVPHISPDQIGSFRVPLPPSSAQRDRIAPIVAAERQFAQLRGCAERQIALLRERRQALITHAVTGRLPIPA